MKTLCSKLRVHTHLSNWNPTAFGDAGVQLPHKQIGLEGARSPNDIGGRTNHTQYILICHRSDYAVPPLKKLWRYYSTGPAIHARVDWISGDQVQNIGHHQITRLNDRFFELTIPNTCCCCCCCCVGGVTDVGGSTTTSELIWLIWGRTQIQNCADRMNDRLSSPYSLPCH